MLKVYESRVDMHWVGDVGVADDNDYVDDNNHVIPIADAYCVHQK